MVCLAVAFLLMSHMGLGTSRARHRAEHAAGRHGDGAHHGAAPHRGAERGAASATWAPRPRPPPSSGRSAGPWGWRCMGAVLSAELGRELQRPGGPVEGSRPAQLGAHRAPGCRDPPGPPAGPAGAGARRVQPGPGQRAPRRVPGRASASPPWPSLSAFLVPAGRAQDLALPGRAGRAVTGLLATCRHLHADGGRLAMGRPARAADLKVDPGDPHPRPDRRGAPHGGRGVRPGRRRGRAAVRGLLRPGRRRPQRVPLRLPHPGRRRPAVPAGRPVVLLEPAAARSSSSRRTARRACTTCCSRPATRPATPSTGSPATPRAPRTSGRPSGRLGVAAHPRPQPVNFFMNVAVRPDGTRATSGRRSTAAGDYVLLRAFRDALVVVSACPQEWNPATNYHPVGSPAAPGEVPSRA